MSNVDIKALEGWLVKKKNSKKVFGADVKRWFKIEKVTGEDDDQELALCYYQSNKAKDSKGWMFLSDISDIIEDTDMFTLVSPNRSLTLEAQTRAEHRLWVNGLRQLSTASFSPTAQDKYPHYSKNGIEAKKLEEKKSTGSRTNTPRSEDGSGGYPRAGPGKSGRAHNSDEIDPYRSRESGGQGGSSSRDVSEERSREGRERGRDRGGYAARESSERGDSREAMSRERSPRDDQSGGGGSGSGRDGLRDSREGRRDDHRLAARNEMPSTDATASARMHGHINRYDTDDKEYKGDTRGPGGGSRSSSRPGSNEGSLGPPTRTQDREYLQERMLSAGEELESLDLSAPAQPSRESRLQERRDRLKDEVDFKGDSDDGGEDEDAYHEGTALDDARKRDTEPAALTSSSPAKKARPAPSGPPPRRAQDAMDSSDDDSTEGKRQTQRPLASSEIDELRPGVGGLSINLDDDSDEDGNLVIDIKAEKRRYRSSGGDDMAKSTDASSRPPRPPVNSRSSSNAASALSTSRSGGGVDGDSNFVSDDWDESFEDSPVKPHNRKKDKESKSDVVTGSRPDSNWLEDDFDD